MHPPLPYNKVYAEYLLPATLHDHHNALIDALQRNLGNNLRSQTALISVSALVQWLLQDAHNSWATQQGFTKYCAAGVIELGFIINAVVLSPIETAIRLIVEPIFILLAGITYCCNSELAATMLAVGVLGVAASALQIGQSSVSASYSHFAYLDRQICNSGQALCYILNQESSLRSAYVHSVWAGLLN